MNFDDFLEGLGKAGLAAWLLVLAVAGFFLLDFLVSLLFGV